MSPMRTSSRGARAALLGVLLLLTAACTADPGGGPDGRSAAAAAHDEVRPPAAGAAFDYQLGGAYPPPDGVLAVARDRTDGPAAGLYNVCYVNAFQTQPDEAVDWWRENHPDLLLRDADGEPVVDEDWDEPLLDISSKEKRTALLGVVGPWIDGCAEDGYDAVEPDNLDSFTRSEGLLTADHAIAFARLLSDRAHAKGLAIAQKNTAELLPARARTGFDFAVAEECARYDECGDFAAAYDGRVFDVEYREPDFTAGCHTWGARVSMTLRDLDVLPAGEPGYVHRVC
ncbi:endo alpha-1,4 polygalactosaminidase [Streptomyces zhihengii]|uniref:endo alpha-1,4 polygalactosaminidase n=1 Tax=Streptomyces zhihengii TaxID=1818004 RepID=UPI003632E899